MSENMKSDLILTYKSLFRLMLVCATVVRMVHVLLCVV